MTEEVNGSKIGAVSLWASILGIIVPILVAFLVRLFVKVNDEPYYILCCLLFVGAELIALVTGIIGRKSPSGKAGMGISLVCIILTALAIPLLTVSKVESRPVQNRPQPSQLAQPYFLKARFQENG